MHKDGIVDELPAHTVEITDGWTSTAVIRQDEYDVYRFEGTADKAIPRHQHPDHLEIAYIVHGEVNFRIGREDKCLSKGGVQRISPGTEHEIICVSKETVVLSIFQPPISIKTKGSAEESPIDHIEIFNQLK